MPGTLYVVGVPIGNFGDLSPRAAEILKNAEIIAAEDPRVTSKLLDYYKIDTKCVLYADFLHCEDGESPAECLMDGKDCAVVSDAGMPVIADPGVDFTAFCRQNGITVKSVPGPCAAITALSISGLNVSRFTFEGFLTVNKPNRMKHLEQIKDEKRAMVFYESPKKLPATLKDLYNTLGDRKVFIAKDLTKSSEESEITSLFEAAQKYDGKKLRGEFVIVVEAV